MLFFFVKSFAVATYPRQVCFYVFHLFILSLIHI